MMTKQGKSTTSTDPGDKTYERQNRTIHAARAQLGMTIDECRKISEEISGKPSISSLSLEQRRQLIDILISLGADVENPALPDTEADLYLSKLEAWTKRFPRQRPGFATNEQLALIEDLWERFFEDGRPGRGLRGFLVRQCGVDDLSFLTAKDVKKIITALKVARRKAKAKGGWR